MDGLVCLRVFVIQVPLLRVKKSQKHCQVMEDRALSFFSQRPTQVAYMWPAQTPPEAI
jgi:hypothetical protein